MVTFADLMTLLLVFFVLLYSLSTLETEKFQSVLSSFQIAFNKYAPSTYKASSDVSIPIESKIKPIDPSPVISEPAVSDVTMKTITEAEETIDQEVSEIQTMVQKLQQSIIELDLNTFIEVFSEDDNVIIRVNGQLLFASGDVKLTESAENIFEKILELVEHYYDYKIAINGHTDNTPISTTRFPSNWELSAVRATTVLRYFIANKVDPKRLSATGFSDLFPIADNDTETGRSQNRRVEFVLEKEK